MLTQAFISQPTPPATVPPGIVATTFVFRPGGVAGGNVYTTWATLYAAFSAVEGPKWVQVDSSLAVATVPAGTWDVRDVNWVGHFGDLGASAQLDFADGAKFTNLSSISQVLSFVSHSTSSVVDVPLGTTYVVYLHEGVNIGCDGTAPFFSVGATNLVLVTFVSAAIVDLGYPVVDLYDAGSQVIVVGFDMGSDALSGRLDPDTISGIAGSTLLLPRDSNSNLSTTQPSFLGTITRIDLDAATRIYYALSPLTTSTVSGAMDQAAYVLQSAANPNAGAGTPALPGWVFTDTGTSPRNVWVNSSGSPTDWKLYAPYPQQKSTGATTTSGAVTVTCDTIPIVDNSVTDLDVVIVGKRSNGGSVAARFRVTGAYQWFAGVVQIIGALTVIAADADAGAAAWNATLVPSGTDVLVQVTGAAGDDIQWYSVTDITVGLVVSP